MPGPLGSVESRGAVELHGPQGLGDPVLSVSRRTTEPGGDLRVVAGAAAPLEIGRFAASSVHAIAASVIAVAFSQGRVGRTSS